MNGVIGIDIGGTKIASAIVLETNELCRIHEIKTPQEGPQEDMIKLQSLISQLLQDAHESDITIRGIGIGIPAALEPETDTILWAPNLRGWRNVELRCALEELFHLPVAIEYDGHTSVLGEYRYGKGRGYHSIVDVVIGTGIGAGIIANDVLLRGADRLAGAVGWQRITTVPPSASIMSKRVGAWENLAAGPGIAAYAQENLSVEEIQQIKGVQPHLTARDLFEAARNGHQPALAITHQIADWIGIGIANILSILNPEVVILGGSVGTSCHFLLPQIQESCRQWAQPIAEKTAAIVISDLGTKAAVYGAAYGLAMRLEKEKKEF